MGLFEHFPYTNFHQLNLDWIVRQLKKKEDRVEALEGRMDQAEADIDALEGRMDTAEGNITNLNTQINGTGGLKDRVTTLETGYNNLKNASMITALNTPTTSASAVGLPYNKTTYTNGVPSSSSGSNTIPGATNTTAGVMTAAQVQELSAATLAISQIGDAYAAALASPVALVNNTNTLIFQHDFVEGYWVLAGAIVYEVVVPNTVVGTCQVDLAGSISSDPNGPGWVGMRNPYFLEAGTYHIALPCSARAYKFNDPGRTGVTSNGCLWGYFKDVDSQGVTVTVLTNLTSETGNKTELEAVRII